MNAYIQKHLCDRYVDKHYVITELAEDGLECVTSYKKKFKLSGNINDTPYYPRKEQRYTIIVEFFRKYFGESVLDVGSRNTLLSEKLGKECDFVDKNNPNLPPFDWEKEQLPYEQETYDTVVCLDVFEHIDNLHEGFYDLLRVSKKHVIISLPNNWKKALNEFIKGRGRWPSYGIPPERPLDRHKWFFNTEDAEDFIYYHAAPSKGNYKVLEVQYHVPKTILRIKLLYPIFRLLLPEYQFKNLFVETVFFVLEKK